MTYRLDACVIGDRVYRQMDAPDKGPKQKEAENYDDEIGHILDPVWPVHLRK